MRRSLDWLSFRPVSDFCRIRIRSDCFSENFRLHPPSVHKLQWLYIDLFLTCLSTLLGVSSSDFLYNLGGLTTVAILLFGYAGTMIWLCLIPPKTKDKPQFYLLIEVAFIVGACDGILVNHFHFHAHCVGILVSALSSVALILGCFVAAVKMTAWVGHGHIFHIYGWGGLFSFISIVVFYWGNHFYYMLGLTCFVIYVIVFSHETATYLHYGDGDDALWQFVARFVTHLYVIPVHLLIIGVKAGVHIKKGTWKRHSGTLKKTSKRMRKGNVRRIL